MSEAAAAPEDIAPRWLEVAIPAVMVIVTVAYAIEVKDIARPELNLILLEPLLIVFWAMLLLVGWFFVVPSLKGGGGRLAEAPPTGAAQAGWLERLGQDVAWRPRLLVALLVVYAVTVFSTNYVASTFVFLVLTSLLLGLRSVVNVAILAVSGAAFLYYTATVVLGILI